MSKELVWAKCCTLPRLQERTRSLASEAKFGAMFLAGSDLQLGVGWQC